MNLYTFLSLGYDLLDVIWFSDKGINPRDAIENMIPDENVRVLDMCCGTFSNGMSIAKKKRKNRVTGLDRSEAMLREAKKKIRREKIKNARLICHDAIDTGLKSDSFDYIVIGLVLHECSLELWKGILDEAHRLLKPDGRLIILEWDKQEKFSRKLKFAPLYAAEALLNPKYFKEFYNSDKSEFFRRYGFEAVKNVKCNYTSVLSLNKI